MIVTLTGDNSFEIAMTVRRLADDFSKKHGANAVDKVEAGQISPDNLPRLLQGISLFAPKRLVIFKNLTENKLIIEALVDYLPKVDNDTFIVIADSGLDKRSRLYKFLKSKTEFKDFANFSDSQLQNWIVQEVVRQGGKIDNAEARYLLLRSGKNQWRLASEIQKLTNFQSDITKDSINLLVDANPEGTAFDLLDAALSGRAQRAAEILAEIKSQEDPYKMFGLLASQVHSLALLASSVGRNVETVARDAKIHPFVAKKMQPLARKLGEAKVASIAESIAVCDRQLKSTSIDPWTLVQLCLQKIAVII